MLFKKLLRLIRKTNTKYSVNQWNHQRNTKNKIPFTCKIINRPIDEICFQTFEEVTEEFETIIDTTQPIPYYIAQYTSGKIDIVTLIKVSTLYDSVRDGVKIVSIKDLNQPLDEESNIYLESKDEGGYFFRIGSESPLDEKGVELYEYNLSNYQLAEPHILDIKLY